MTSDSVIVPRFRAPLRPVTTLNIPASHSRCSSLPNTFSLILIAALTSLMFLGGWLSPFPQSWGFIGTPLRILDVRENGGGAVLVPGSVQLSTLPLRPNHAFGLESADSDRLRLHRDFGRVDDFTAEFVEISFRRHLEAV